jgi:hypothetical protein
LCWHILRTAYNTIVSFTSQKLGCLVLARFKTDSEPVGVDVMKLMMATTQSDEAETCRDNIARTARRQRDETVKNSVFQDD